MSALFFNKACTISGAPLDTAFVNADSPFSFFALISFVFTGDVAPLDGVLGKSPNSSVGFYRYLHTTPGSNEGEISITVPKMAMLREIKLQLWKDAIVTLQQLDIQQSD